MPKQKYLIFALIVVIFSTALIFGQTRKAVPFDVITTDYSSNNQQATFTTFPVMVRRNSTDKYLSGFFGDFSGAYVGGNEDLVPGMNVYFDIQSESPYSSSAYRGLQVVLQHSTTDLNRNGKSLTAGAFSSVAGGGADIHDLKGIYSEAVVSNGTRIGSNMSGGAFSVAVWGGAGHADVANIIAGASAVNNTDVRSYQLFWLRKSNLTNVTHRDFGEPFAIRDDSGYLSRFFGNIRLDNTNANSAGPEKVPLTIKLNSSQSADAFNIFASDGTTNRFTVSASGDTTVGGKLHVSTPQTPVSASDSCKTGQFAWDSTFTYVCVAPNTWKRVALSSW